MVSNEKRVLSALKRKMRVTRKTAIEHGWCENLTATISRLRKLGFVIEALPFWIFRKPRSSSSSIKHCIRIGDNGGYISSISFFENSFKILSTLIPGFCETLLNITICLLK